MKVTSKHRGGEAAVRGPHWAQLIGTAPEPEQASCCLGWRNPSQGSAAVLCKASVAATGTADAVLWRLVLRLATGLTGRLGVEPQTAKLGWCEARLVS